MLLFAQQKNFKWLRNQLSFREIESREPICLTSSTVDKQTSIWFHLLIHKQHTWLSISYSQDLIAHASTIAVVVALCLQALDLTVNILGLTPNFLIRCCSTHVLFANWQPTTLSLLRWLVMVNASSMNVEWCVTCIYACIAWTCCSRCLRTIVEPSSLLGRLLAGACNLAV